MAKRIALAARGVTIPQPNSPISLVREGVRLTTASAAYSWLNPLHIFGIGTVDITTGEIEVRCYVPN
jgi:hypothetical protein